MKTSWIEYAVTTLVVLATAGLTYVLWLWVKYLAIEQLGRWAKAYKHFVSPPESSVTIITQGGEGDDSKTSASDPVDMIVNIDGHIGVYVISSSNKKKEHWRVIEDNDAAKREYIDELAARNFHYNVGDIKLFPDPEHTKAPRRIRNFFFFGLFSDMNVHEIKFDAARWKSGTDNDGKFSEVEHKSEKVRSLRAMPERRMSFEGQEIVDGKQVKLKTSWTIILRIKKPLVAIFDRAGNFYEIIDSGMEDLVKEEVRMLDSNRVIGVAHDGGIQLNDTEKLFNLDQLQIDLNKRIVESGFEVTKIYFKGYDVDDATQKLVDSNRAVSIAKNESAANVARAEGIAAVDTASMTAASKIVGVDPNVAIVTLGRIKAAERMGAKGGTWVEGNSTPISIAIVPKKSTEEGEPTE